MDYLTWFFLAFAGWSVVAFNVLFCRVDMLRRDVDLTWDELHWFMELVRKELPGLEPETGDVLYYGYGDGI